MYQADAGKPPFSIAGGPRSAECPVSAITPRSLELLDIFVRAKRMKEASGAGLYGPDLSSWPAWAVDVIDALEGESMSVENARWDAEHGKGG